MPYKVPTVYYSNLEIFNCHNKFTQYNNIMCSASYDSMPYVMKTILYIVGITFKFLSYYPFYTFFLNNQIYRTYSDVSTIIFYFLP